MEMLTRGVQMKRIDCTGLQLTLYLWFATLTQILLRKTSQTPETLGEMAHKVDFLTYTS